MATFKLDRVRIAVKNYLAEDNKDFDLALNLAELIKAVGVRQTHVIMTHVPEHLAQDILTWRAISLWASKVLCDDGLLVLVGTIDNLPASSYIKELSFVTSTSVQKTGETVFVFQKPHGWFGAIKKRQINISFGFKDYQGLIAGLTQRGELILDPFQRELRIANDVLESDCAFIGANAAASSVEDMIGSLVVKSCSK